MNFDNGYGVLPSNYKLAPNERYGLEDEIEFQNLAKKIRNDENTNINTGIKFYK